MGKRSEITYQKFELKNEKGKAMKTIKITYPEFENCYVLYKQDTGNKWSLWVWNPIIKRDTVFETGISTLELLDVLRRFKEKDIYTYQYALEK